MTHSTTRWLSVTLLANACSLTAQAFEEAGKHALPWREDWSHAVAAGDVDGDGDVDVVFAAARLPVTLYRNDGLGMFTAGPTQFPAATNDAVALLFLDVDADEDLDLFVVTSRLLLFHNDGRGRFTDASHLVPGDMVTTLDLAAADLDRDGDPDLVLASVGQSRIYTNTGMGRFVDATARLAPIRLDPSHSVSLGDVDGDGDVDVLLGNIATSRDRLWINDGTGAFQDGTVGRLPDHQDSTNDTALGDLDGDGDLDLVTVNSADADRVYHNDGQGHFTFVINALPTVGLGSTTCALADLDGDGRLDVFVGTDYRADYRNRPLVLHNRGDGTFVHRIASPALLDNPTVQAAAFADVDGDGDCDLLLATGSALFPEQARIGVNDGAGRFRDATERAGPPVRHRTLSLAVSDLDRDGPLDVVVAGTLWPGEISVLTCVGDGYGRIRTRGMLLATVYDTPRIVVAADFNGDGHVDLFLGTEAYDQLFFNNGRGGFADATWGNLPPSSLDPCDAAAGADLDGDTDVDLLVAEDGVLRILRNDGRGRFEVTGQMSAQLGAIAIGDVDRDGDLDLILGGSGYGAVRHALWLNVGRLSFTQASQGRMPGTGTSAFGVRLVDVDGDDDLDAVFASNLRNQLYLNDGTGSFRDVTADRLPPDVGAEAVDAGDVDGDGDVDLVFGGHAWASAVQTRLYRNDGGGRFTDATSALPQETQAGTAIALADLDDDGDLDLVQAGQYRTRITVYSNLRRQITSPDLPTLGRRHRLDFRANDLPHPTLAVLPLLATAPARIPLPPLGVLRLDLASTVVGTPLPMPGPGAVVTFSFPLPADPALRGRTLYAQALFVDAQGAVTLSNAIADEMSR